MTIRVVLADDQPLMRAGFRMLIQTAADIEVVGEASTGREAVRLAHETGADVVLMDIRMPEMDGLAATRAITGDERLAGVRVLILTTFEADEDVLRALRHGASGFLGKREREVLGLVAGGLSNEAIAGRLHVSPLTAKTHVNRIMAKVGARDRAQLVVLAYRTGFARADRWATGRRR